MRLCEQMNGRYIRVLEQGYNALPTVVASEHSVYVSASGDFIE